MKRKKTRYPGVVEYRTQEGDIIYYNYRLGDDIQSKVLAFAFGLAAEIERNLISQRTKNALARKRAEGIVLGRPKGRKSTTVKLSGKENKIMSMLRDGFPNTKIAEQFGVHRQTVDKFVKDKLNYLPRNALHFFCPRLRLRSTNMLPCGDRPECWKGTPCDCIPEGAQPVSGSRWVDPEPVMRAPREAFGIGRGVPAGDM